MVWLIRQLELGFGAESRAAYHASQGGQAARAALMRFASSGFSLR
jgi:hypothetical protein